MFLIEYGHVRGKIVSDRRQTCSVWSRSTQRSTVAYAVHSIPMYKSRNFGYNQRSYNTRYGELDRERKKRCATLEQETSQVSRLARANATYDTARPRQSTRVECRSAIKALLTHIPTRQSLPQYPFSGPGMYEISGEKPASSFPGKRRVRIRGAGILPHHHQVWGIFGRIERTIVPPLWV